MEPALHNGATSYVSEIIPKVLKLHRGDIVGASIKINNGSTRVIKRIIGLPGEHVILQDGKIYINGHLLHEGYITTLIKTEGEFDYILDKDEYILLGDNREDSLDSRDERFGVVKKKEIDFVLLEPKISKEWMERYNYER